jgi:hypothetical protein
MGHITSVIRVSSSPGGDASQQVSGNYDIRSGSANALGRTLSKRIYATGAHVAVSATQTKFPKATLRLLLFIAIPCSFQASSLADIEHILAGRIY